MRGKKIGVEDHDAGGAETLGGDPIASSCQPPTRRNQNEADCPAKLAPIPWVYGEIARVIANYEPVEILCHSAAFYDNAGAILESHGVPWDAVRRIPSVERAATAMIQGQAHAGIALL